MVQMALQETRALTTKKSHHPIFQFTTISVIETKKMSAPLKVAPGYQSEEITRESIKKNKAVKKSSYHIRINSYLYDFTHI